MSGRCITGELKPVMDVIHKDYPEVGKGKPWCRKYDLRSKTR